MKTLYIDRCHFQHISSEALRALVAAEQQAYKPDRLALLSEDPEQLARQVRALMEETGAGRLLTSVRGREYWAVVPSQVAVAVWNGRPVNHLGLPEWALMVAPDGPHCTRVKARELVKKGQFENPRGKYAEDIQQAVRWLEGLEPEEPYYTVVRAPQAARNYQRVDDLPEEFFAQLVSTWDSRVAFDIETTGLDYTVHELLGLSFCAEAGMAYYIPCGTLPPVAAAVLAHPGIGKVTHNGKFDYKFLLAHGYTVNNIAEDTNIMGYLLQLPHLQLKDLGEELLDYVTTHFEDIVPEGKTFADVEEAVAVEYGCQDADLTFQLCRVLTERLKGEGNLYSVYKEIEMPLLPILAQMELDGAPVDIAAAASLARSTENDVAILEKVMWETAGQEFDPNSPKDLAFILFEKLGLTPLKENKNGLSTDKFVLERLKEDHQLVALILEWRKRTKLLSTYLHPILEAQNARVHGQFNQTVTVTGRLSASRPNLQNQDPITRTVYRVDPGKLFIAADYAQQELRILAHASQDPAMLEAFRTGVDIHEQTSTLLHIPRRLAKNVNFGIPYGAGAAAIARQGKCTVAEAQAMLDAHRKTYPVLWAHMEGIKVGARRDGYVESLWGRRRYLPKIFSRVPEDVAAAEREAVNMTIQGSAADVTKLAMINLVDVLAPYRDICRMIIQVHDELVFELDDPAYLDDVSRLIEETMTAADGGLLSVPLEVTAKHGSRWADLK